MPEDAGPTLDDARLTDHERFNRSDWIAYSDAHRGAAAVPGVAPSRPGLTVGH